MNQRGFTMTALAWVFAAIALLGMLTGIAASIFKAGEKAKQVEWDRKIAADTALEKARALDVSDAIKEKESQRIAATERAADSDAKWKDQAREARRLSAQLALHVPAKSAPEPGNAGPAARPGLRLTWNFVSLHDGAFTGADGKPVFGASAQYAAAPERADTASPYGFDELVEVHGENARAFSACLRAFDDAVSKVRAAEAAWGKRR